MSSETEEAIATRAAFTDRDRELLRLYAMAWRYEGIRDQRIHEATGLHSTAAAQRVNVLLDMPEALAAMPMEVRRLQRLRSRGMRSRRAR